MNRIAQHLGTEADRIIRDQIYQLEHNIWSAQPLAEGYSREFRYTIHLTMTINDYSIQATIIVTGFAACGAAFGFNVYYHDVQVIFPNKEEVP